MASLVKITTRFTDAEEIALISCAVSLGIVDRNGKAKVSTFIKHAIKSNTVYKNKLISINKLMEKK